MRADKRRSSKFVERRAPSPVHADDSP